MMFVQAAEQTPIPCRNCGASMKEHGPGGGGLVSAVQVICPYCNATEVLPEQQAERVRALRGRLAQLRWAQEAEEGPALAFAKTMQMVRGQWMIGGAIMAVAFLGSLGGAGKMVYQAITMPDLDKASRLEILNAGLSTPAFGVGVTAGVLIGYYLALREYKKAIEPRLRARAPVQPGLPARCRSCGADLPAELRTGAFVPCTHCSANNLVTAELARDRVRLLEQEARSYQARAAGVLDRAQAASVNFNRYFFIGGGVGLAIALLLAGIAQVVLRVVFI